MRWTRGLLKTQPINPRITADVNLEFLLERMELHHCNEAKHYHRGGQSHWCPRHASVRKTNAVNAPPTSQAESSGQSPNHGTGRSCVNDRDETSNDEPRLSIFKVDAILAEAIEILSIH